MSQPCDPIDALEDAIRPALQRTPCFVEFSGGRDSSVVLAASVRLARREGFEEPVPMTQRFPGLSETDENEWQESVIRHLGVGEWLRYDMTDEADLLGPAALRSLECHGPLWPPLAHTRAPILTIARDGSLLSGEGGDEILGPRRLDPWRALCSGKWGRGELRAASLAVAPRQVRRRRFREIFRSSLTLNWLTPDAREDLLGALATEAAGEPLDWRRAARLHPNTRSVAIGMVTLDTLALSEDVITIHPFLQPAFIDSLCAFGGSRGFAGRTAALRAIFPGLLPDAVLSRSTKARFGRAAFNVHSRSFARSWRGAGAEPGLVVPEALQRVWEEDEPNAMTFPLLHNCWLATAGR